MVEQQDKLGGVHRCSSNKIRCYRFQTHQSKQCSTVRPATPKIKRKYLFRDVSRTRKEITCDDRKEVGVETDEKVLNLQALLRNVPIVIAMHISITRASLAGKIIDLSLPEPLLSLILRPA
jgi:hypothetical protein